MAHRQKLSTTIGPENLEYLRQMVKAGRASSVGEAVDKTIELARRAGSRSRLQAATAAYFSRLSPKATEEDAELEAALSDASREADFDQPLVYFHGAAKSGQQNWGIRRPGTGSW